MKFEAGLFENSYADADYAEQITDDEEARALAEEAARRSVVLLKNDGILPLDASDLTSIAVIGPNAAVTRLGGYSYVPTRTISLLEGLREEVGDSVLISHHEGVKLFEDGDGWWTDSPTPADRDNNLRMIEEAVGVAEEADLVILAIGGSEATSREAYAANHLGDRSDIELFGEQKELAEAIFDTGKPVVTVLINGRPLGAEMVAERTNGLLEAWYLGQETGTALADILVGEANPGGKLPVTIPRDVGQLPLVYNHKPSALRGFPFGSTEPLFPFGYGLSYTTFDIGAPSIRRDTIKSDGSATVSVRVRNTGDVEGTEVVQLYIRDKGSSVTRPVKELRGFERVTLRPGQSRTVRFTVDAEDLMFWGADMQRVVEPGEFEIMVGPNSVDLKTATLTVSSEG